MERAKDFIAMLYPMIENCEVLREYRNAVEKFNACYSRSVKCANGLARVAFITSDYVVKYEYDEEEVGYIGGGDNEVAMYEIAKQEGFEYLFAQVTRYDYEGKRFYIMPRINGIGSCPYDEAFAHMSKEECAFCKRHHLTDLHGQNYGFREGHVCIIDYACRYSWSSEYSSEYSA